MKRTPISLDLSEYPEELASLLMGTKVFDSSCSAEAKVIFIDKDNGYFLKSAPKGSLRKEAELTKYFHSKGLAPDAPVYISDARDWLLSERAAGEDCVYQRYLDEPTRLCDTLAEILRALHETDAADCPERNRISAYLALADENYRNGIYDTSLFPDNWGFSSAEKAYETLREGRCLLKNDTLIHGDYCLPNVILDNWLFSAFIDLGNGGVGDRHIDIFWGAWSLFFNLKTDKYSYRFLDAYGGDRVDKDTLKIVAAAEVFG